MRLKIIVGLKLTKKCFKKKFKKVHQSQKKMPRILNGVIQQDSKGYNPLGTERTFRCSSNCKKPSWCSKDTLCSKKAIVLYLLVCLCSGLILLLGSIFMYVNDKRSQANGGSSDESTVESIKGITHTLQILIDTLPFNSRLWEKNVTQMFKQNVIKKNHTIKRKKNVCMNVKPPFFVLILCVQCNCGDDTQFKNERIVLWFEWCRI
ncbi:hypothetical protein RFI_26645 [Reticulomyxa filosa]|uniref:Uncharacterized protein n=1 Tax=Reticulomyxa filosa TaxID=46433 RepID=X6MB83_RETFI|nr:hypothetical protein RFI_26645 [Reticulomyxa filosa]|eukprot:ETO10732.1 hypothetical protein RFI_26645 [Reticulomyxa filosa]